MNEKEFVDYFNTLGFKKNPNGYNIVEKWNRKLYKQYKYDIFDWIDKYIDKHIAEFIQPSIYDLTSANTFNYGDKIIPIDEDEHMWYNKFNKWNWTKFEDGVVIKYDEKRI